MGTKQDQRSLARNIAGISQLHVHLPRPMWPGTAVPAGFDIAETDAWQDFSMYVHFPFCRMNCNFCSLHRQTAHNESMVSGYLQSLRRELRLLGESRCVPPLQALYLGGGTPTMLSADELNELLDCIAAAAQIPSGADVEVTIECAPEAGRDAQGGTRYSGLSPHDACFPLPGSAWVWRHGVMSYWPAWDGQQRQYPRYVPCWALSTNRWPLTTSISS